MRKIREVIVKEFGRSDFTLVINTHGDWDHCSGNQVFDDAFIIGHELCPGAIMHAPANTASNIWFLKKGLARSKERLDSLDVHSEEARQLRRENAAREMIVRDLEKEYRPTPPFLTFSDRLTIDADGITLELLYCGEAHTDSDILVYVPQEGLLMTGDLFAGKEGFGFKVNKMMDVPAIESAIDHVLNSKRKVSTVVPGHGDLLNLQDLVNLRSLLQTRWEELGAKQSAARLLEKAILTSGIETGRMEYRRLTEKGNAELSFSEEEFCTLGSRLARKGRIEEAIAVLEIAVESFPNSGLAQATLGDAYLEKGDRKSALERYKAALAIVPEYGFAAEMVKMLSSQP